MKTRDQHIADGTYREDRHAGPEVEVILPHIPEWLASIPHAAELYDEIGAQLVANKCISEADRHAFAQLIFHIYNAERLAIRSTVEGALSRTELSLLKESNAMMLKLLVQFGLSPKSRTGLTGGGPADDDPLVDLFKDREKQDGVQAGV
jgi:phage terminase small subunit